jgi:C4-dicarboxylate-specific signal transduction histidine kinase
VQVFLNIAKNSRWAMTTADTRRLRIAAAEENGKVMIRFEDTGIGVASPERLFRPFQSAANSCGLGLTISRAIMRSVGGDLSHEPRPEGCCFVVALPVHGGAEGGANG